MDQYNALMDKIGDAIISWSDPTGKWRADREVSISRPLFCWCGCGREIDVGAMACFVKKLVV